MKRGLIGCLCFIAGACIAASLHIASPEEVLAAPAAYQAQQPQGPPPQQAGERITSVASPEGRRLFTANCGFCHGSDARGGAEGGPDLTRSAIATGDPHQFAAFLKTGRPPRMPAFDLPDTQVASISAFITTQASAARSGGTTDPNAILVGDASAGKTYFEGTGKCVTCHSVTGDLKGIGSRYTPQQLQGRMVLARGTGGYPGLRFAGQATAVDKPRTADVVSGGKVIHGDIVSVSDYVITLKQSDGTMRSFARDGGEPKVTIHDPLQAHIDMLPKWTDRDMHNVTAYLVTLK